MASESDWEFYVAFVIGKQTPEGQEMVEALRQGQPRQSFAEYDAQMVRSLAAVASEWQGVWQAAWKTFPRAWQTYQPLLSQCIHIQVNKQHFLRAGPWTVIECFLYSVDPTVPARKLYVPSQVIECWSHLVYWNSLPYRIDAMIGQRIKTQPRPQGELVSKWSRELVLYLSPQIHVLKQLLPLFHLWM